MRNLARKTMTATLTIAATAAFGLGASSEAWGGKTSSWDRVGVTKTSSWDKGSTTGTSSWDKASTTRTSSWDTSSWD